MSKVDLSKMMMIYMYLMMTTNPNATSQEARKKLKKKLRHIFTHQQDKYRESEDLKKKVYEEAWMNVFKSKQTSAYVSLGTVMAKLYNSIEKQTLVGHKLMKRVFDSYHHCDVSNEITDKEEIEMEKNGIDLANEILKLLGHKKDMRLSRLRHNIQNNMIIEGKR